MPSSPKRLAANRANAAQSTGPRTPEGKTRSAQNARKHGFTASKFAVVRLEELDALANLRDDAIATYQPINSQELFAIERIALAQQALLRCAHLEAGLHTEAMDEIISMPDGEPKNLFSEALTGDIEVTRHQNRSLCLAIGFRRISQKAEVWRLFLRYQAQTERLYRRAVEELERLRALRSELPNEPTPEPEIEEIQPLVRPKIEWETEPEAETNGLPSFPPADAPQKEVSPSATEPLLSPIAEETPKPPSSRRPVSRQPAMRKLRSDSKPSGADLVRTGT